MRGFAHGGASGVCQVESLVLILIEYCERSGFPAAAFPGALAPVAHLINRVQRADRRERSPVCTSPKSDLKMAVRKFATTAAANAEIHVFDNPSKQAKQIPARTETCRHSSLLCKWPCSIIRRFSVRSAPNQRRNGVR